jgi:hypothetical protein
MISVPENSTISELTVDSCSSFFSFLYCVLYFVRPVSCVPNVVSSSGLCVVLCSSCVLCTQCCQFFWIVCCTLFVLCLVYPMLSVPLDCVLYFVRPVSCVPNVVSSSGLCVVLCSSCVLCTQCCQFLWIVHS